MNIRTYCLDFNRVSYAVVSGIAPSLVTHFPKDVVEIIKDKQLKMPWRRWHHQTRAIHVK
jgi:CTP-dependent riboflavin kinase